MAYLEDGNVSLHYTDTGAGEPIITLHGLAESGLYWTLPGITDRLVAAGYRVINLDMRGHGYSRVEGTPKGYNVETIAADIEWLADTLQLEKFHLLTHATGGIAGFRYAMKHSERLLSVMATDTGSAALPTDEYSQLTETDVEIPRVDITTVPLGQQLISAFRNQSWEKIMSGSRKVAKQHIFLNRMHTAVQPESAFAMNSAVTSMADPNEIADFISEYYCDPDPQIVGLRQIQCPCLMLLGEFDELFIQPAELVAREVPNCKHVVLDGMGHMLAFENPQRLGDELLSFLATL